MADTRIAIFRSKKIRKTIHKNEWWFSVVDIVEALTDSVNPRDYWFKMKIRVKSEDGLELSTNCRQLKLESADGKKYETDCANTEGIFRIIQSIPSPKAEPFKRWLARVGYERVQEIEDPELATKRTRALYKAKATFGLTPSEYKKVKGLKRENLRDHMGDLELIFSMLGEASTTEIVRSKNAQGFSENKTAAKKGGKIAGDARKKLEIESGRGIVTSKNYLPKKRIG